MNKGIALIWALLSISPVIGAERKKAHATPKKPAKSSESPGEAAILTSLLKHYLTMRDKTPREIASRDSLIKQRTEYAKQLDMHLAAEVINQCQGFALNGDVNEDEQKCHSINDLIACPGCLTNLIETERRWKSTVLCGGELARINSALNAIEEAHYTKVRATLINYSRMLMECPAHA